LFISKLLYADYAALDSESTEEMQDLSN